MSIDYHVHVGAYVVCIGPTWLGGTPHFDAFEAELSLAQDMCSGDLVEGAWVFVGNGCLEQTWSWAREGNTPDVVALPCKGDATAEMVVVCESALDALAKLFRSVEIREGILTWAS